MVLLASAFFWSWFDLGVFRPTLIGPFPELWGMFPTFLVAAIAGGGIVLAVACVRPSIVLFDALHPRVWALAAIEAIAGALFCTVGGFVSCTAAIVVGALLAGASCGMFQIAWGSYYARRGSSFAGKAVAASIALGALFDALVMSLDGWSAVGLCAAMPVFSAAISIWALRGVARGEEGRRTSHEEASSLGKDTVSGREIMGLPITLIGAFVLFGLAFGFCQYAAIFSTGGQQSLSSDALIAARGVTAAAVACLLAWRPGHAYTVFKLGTMVGIAGFVAEPLLSSFGADDVVSGCVFAIGYTTFDICTWALITELRAIGSKSANRLVGLGRGAIHVAEALALGGCALLSRFPQASAALPSTFGYACVVAEMLLLADNSSLWLLIRARVSGPVPVSPVASHGFSVAQVALDYGLTEREAEVLAILLAGHGRARAAQALGISENTLGTHIQQLYRKLDVHSRQELLDRFAR